MNRDKKYASLADAQVQTKRFEALCDGISGRAEGGDSADMMVGASAVMAIARCETQLRSVLEG